MEKLCASTIKCDQENMQKLNFYWNYDAFETYYSEKFSPFQS